MYRAGLIAIYLGIGLVAVGLIVGFTFMFMGNDNLAKSTLLSPPKDKR